MSFLQLESIIKRLRSGVVQLSDGEVKTILNHLMDQVDELKRQVESLRRPESSGGIEAKNTDGRVRRGRKPKQDSGETGETPRDA